MSKRIIAIGDIHGYAKALCGLLRWIDVQPSDTLITLGDYVDYGPDAQKVLDCLIELSNRCHLVPLMGNHEQMMRDARRDSDRFEFWMRFGAKATLDSYGATEAMEQIPQSHWDFLDHLPMHYETKRHFFIHANYYPNRRLEEQDSQTTLWRPLQAGDIPGRHFSGKTAIVGHTVTANHKIFDLGHLKNIDTGCGYGGVLTALDVAAEKVWQVTEDGEPMLP